MKKLNSLSMKSLGFTAKEIRKTVEDAGEAVFLGRFGGVVTEFFTGESKNGEWIGFKGQFLGVNNSCKKYTAPICFFPAGIANGLRDKLEQGVIEIEIQADVYAIESDKNASGYAYLCEPVLSEEKQDRLEKMANSLTKGLPQNVVAIEDKTAAKK